MRRKENKCAIIQYFVITYIIIFNGTHCFEFHSDVTCFHLEVLPLKCLVRFSTSSEFSHLFLAQFLLISYHWYKMDNRILIVFCLSFLFITLNMLSHYFLESIVSVNKSAHFLLGLPYK